MKYLKYLWFLIALCVAAWILIGCSAQMALKIRFDCPVSDLQLELQAQPPQTEEIMQKAKNPEEFFLNALSGIFPDCQRPDVHQDERKLEDRPKVPSHSAEHLSGRQAAFF